MSKSVPYLAASLFAALLISLSAHADTQTPGGYGILSRCTELIQSACGWKSKPLDSYSMQRATCCATAQTIINRRCSTAAFAAETSRLPTDSASLDKGSALARNLLTFYCLCSI
jgi:hypothetical protein